MTKKKDLYLVEGCGMRFGRDATGHIKEETMAVSEKKAIQNVLFRKKQEMGLNPNTKMDFEGKVTKLS